MNQKETDHTTQGWGLLEWFHFEDHEHVERAVEQIRELRVPHLRTGFSWADFLRPGGREWFDWMLPRLAEVTELLPCFHYTPPSLGLEPKVSSPPREPKDYADFLDVAINRYGKYFEYVELWNEPNNQSEYDYTLDYHWQRFQTMIGMAAYWARHLGKKTVLGGMAPFDPNWLRMMLENGALQCIDVVGLHGFPGMSHLNWRGWESMVTEARTMLEAHGHSGEIWITEGGVSTRQHSERQQLGEFLQLQRTSASRFYWYSLNDLPDHLPTVDGFHLDEREYHFGIVDTRRRPKLLYQLLRDQGAEQLGQFGWITARKELKHQNGNARPKAVVTGGAGFVGANLVDRLVREGYRVTILDNLSREGVLRNLQWLRRRHEAHLDIVIDDVRQASVVNDAVAGASVIFHLAAQVAVTTSFDDPRHDLQTNVIGTFNILEAARRQEKPPLVVYTSTNKVYGALPDLPLLEDELRYRPADEQIARYGVGENICLDFHSPYGCSKGAADAYVLDYARSFDVPTVVFRMSCIYGPHQCGNEDQGWVAHFLISALNGEAITLYGDGKQVRDILFVEDLVEAFLAAVRHQDRLRGQAFNLGGGPQNAVSLLEVLDFAGEALEEPMQVSHGPWRPGDQRYYVSDTRRFHELTGWAPHVSCQEGIARLLHWLRENGVTVDGGRVTVTVDGRR